MLKDLEIPNPNFRMSSITGSHASFPAIHSSLKAKASITNVRMIIEKNFDDFMVEDAHGFYPLHYACRFSANDVDLFELLIDSCPAAAVVQPDRFNRYPLHIACDSNPSPLVIKMLLETHFNAKDIVKEKTKYTEVCMYVSSLTLNCIRHIFFKNLYMIERVCLYISLAMQEQMSKSSRHFWKQTFLVNPSEQ